MRRPHSIRRQISAFGIAVALVLAVDGRGSAQTVHPCDQPLPVNPILTSPVRVAFCHNGLGEDGSAVQVIAFRAYIDGQLVFNDLLTPIGSPTPDGRAYYETPPIVVALGNHVSNVSAVTVDGGEGPWSTDYPFGLADGPVRPSAPTHAHVKK